MQTPDFHVPESSLLPLEEFPELLRVLQEGKDRQLHTGVQIYVSSRCQPVLSTGFGDAKIGTELTPEHSSLWRSAGKPLTAFLIMQRVLADLITLDTQLGEVLPESVQTSKSDITLRQLLTHTSGFPDAETGWPFASWNESIRQILSSSVSEQPSTAAYHPLSSWFLLGEIIQRTSNVPDDFSGCLRRELLLPLGMHQTQTGDSSENPGSFPATTLYERTAGKLTESVYNNPEYRSRVSPGGSLRGPVSDLGKFYETLLRQGRLPDGTRLTSADTVSLMVSRHRTGQFDLTLQHIIDFGLGLIINSNQYGADTVPYGFGRYCSPDTYGHGGSQCSIGFCDPERELVVAWAANGFCGEGQHQRRNRAINEAIYRDLSLC
jgi:CubicO group peptidase (beta-lactamase class C family)